MCNTIACHSSATDNQTVFMRFVARLKKVFNPYCVGFMMIYVGNYFLAAKLKLYNTDETLAIFIVIGVAFSAISYYLTRKSTPITMRAGCRKNEIYVLGALLVFVSITLIFGSNTLFPTPAQPGQTSEAATLTGKVLIFVIIPFLVYHRLFRFKPSDFGLTTNWKSVFTGRNLVVFLVISLLFVLLNYYGGSGARPIREGHYAMSQLLTAAPLLFVWLLIEVGLVEEFFFRGLLQNRLAVFLKSDIGAICITALLFGIIHAPGMYFRGAGVVEGLGSSPPFLTVISYCIAVQAVPGLFLGIIWSKTRNLWLLMAIHAMIDLLPSLPEFIGIWNI
ncbi:MAG: CPBP family intramembrane glutamic endopeptidase [Bacteroidota bacterium]